MQVTTDSTDLICAGITPYITSTAQLATTPGAYASGTGYAPLGSAISSPGMGATAPGFEFATYSTSSGPTRGTQQYNYGPYQNPSSNTIVSALKRINLNRPLTPYPTYDLTQRHDDASQSTWAAQYVKATQDRQQFADDIYRTLLVVTGTPYPLAPAAPTDTELAPMRYLAQIAVNIVDYIDEDNISTMFNFYGTKDGLVATSLGADVSALGTYPPNIDAPRYWVAGTEQPRLILNEVLAEAADSITAPGSATANVKVWAELYNPLVPLGGDTTLRPEDANPVPLQVAAASMGSASTSANAAAYAPYRLVVTKPSTVVPMLGNADGFAQTPTNANALGAADVGTYLPLAATTDADFATSATLYPAAPGTGLPSVGVTGGTLPPYFLLGPQTDGAAGTWMCDPLATSTVPSGTPFLRLTDLSYTVDWSGATIANDQRGTGVTFLLRRLANPHAPNDPNPTMISGGNTVINPWYNPYITIDYIDQVPVRSPVTDGMGVMNGNYASRSRVQPFASMTTLTGGNLRTPDTTNSQVQDSAAATVDTNVKPPSGSTPAITGTAHTFGQGNNPSPTPYQWLVHLDRQVISPMELLHVSGYSPHLLTQKFMTGSATANQFNHMAPWLDQDLISPPTAQTQSHRLYRLFEFLDANSRPQWTSIGNRIPGKININTIFESPGQRAGGTTFNEVWRALCDSNPNNLFNRDATNTYSATTPYNTVPDAVFANLLSSRTPINPTTNPLGLVPQITDKPFMGIASGLVSSGDVQYSSGLGIGNTILRPLSATSATTFQGGTTQLLLEDPNVSATSPPYQRYQLLTKIFNNVTNRSNVFAVWLTVGFFQVEDSTTTPPRLGVEIRAAEGLNIRHRMFAIVDRTNVLLYTSTIPASGLAPTTTFGTTTYSPVDSMSMPTDLITWFTASTMSSPAPKWALATTGAVAPLIGTAALPGPLLSAGTVLVAEPFTANEEAAIVTQDTATPPLLHVTFQRSHAAGSAIAIRGNPGPWPTSPITVSSYQDTVPPTYDVRNDPNVVLMWSIIN
jgi:hypothetical protein